MRERSRKRENVSPPHTARDGESAISSVRPKTGYHFFLRTQSARSVAQNTGGCAKQPGYDVVNGLGRRWKAMPVATKEEWNQAAREDYELRVQAARAAAHAASRAATVAKAAAEAAAAACAALPSGSSPHASFISSSVWRCTHCDRRWYVAACSCCWLLLLPVSRCRRRGGCRNDLRHVRRRHGRPPLRAGARRAPELTCRLCVCVLLPRSCSQEFQPTLTAFEWADAAASVVGATPAALHNRAHAEARLVAEGWPCLCRTMPPDAMTQKVSATLRNHQPCPLSIPCDLLNVYTPPSTMLDLVPAGSVGSPQYHAWVETCRRHPHLLIRGHQESMLHFIG